LTVKDSVGLTSIPRYLAVSVVPASVADAGPPECLISVSGGTVATSPAGDQSLVVTGGSGAVTLSATKSQSHNGGKLTYYWTQIQGTPTVVSGASSGTGTLVVDQAGDYEFELRVSDGSVTSAPAVVKFSVAFSPDSTLVSGTHVSSTSGGCEIGTA